MSLQQRIVRKTTLVDESPLRGAPCAASRLAAWFAGLLVSCALLAGALPAYAAGTLTNDITDTQNLLGSNVSTVTDRMKQVERDQGVHVRLLYVDSFGENAKPVKWATTVLESTDPDPNTVLLAVASGDGSLVVVVSSNSDSWLRNQDTVDALSQAALDPLTTQGKQNWSGAAIGMMDALAQRREDMLRVRRIAIGAAVAIVVVAGAVVAVLVIVNKRSGKGGRHSAPRRKRKA